MKIRVEKIDIIDLLSIREIKFKKENNEIGYARIPFNHPDKTWEHLSVGSYVKGLVLSPDRSSISPDSKITVIPEGMEDVAEVIKIHPAKLSINKDTTYIRLDIMLPDGTFSKTDVCQSYRNYARWKPIIASGVGTKITGLIIGHNVKPYTVDADSPVRIWEPKK